MNFNQDVRISELSSILLAIRNAGQQILDGLNPQDFHEAINWGDLFVARCLLILDDDNRQWVRVEIEEAADGCEQLCATVSRGLAELGYLDVEVTTQW